MDGTKFKEALEAYRKEVLAAITNTTSVEEVDAIKRQTIGKNGEITQALKALWSKK